MSELTNRGIPFAERGGRLRGLLDLACGRYPRFVLGGGLGGTLPVFHFHEVTRAGLEPYLRYLTDNGYNTVTSEEITRFAASGTSPGPRSVALCFDDAWASLWTVAHPLLAQYGQHAITYAIPMRIDPSESTRPTLETDPAVAESADRSDRPFAGWGELKAMSASGVVDVQSHTYSHSRIFCSPQIVGFVTPQFLDSTMLARPRGDGDGEEPSFLGTEQLGAPVHVNRSRMSDGRRFFPDPAARERCVEHVRREGEAAFFARPDWRDELTRLAGAPAGRHEDPAAQEAAILDELVRAREVLERRLGPHAVRHICFPWGVTGRVAGGCLARAGYDSAFADRMFGFRGVRAGDDPHRLMRLPHRYILRLPGRSRRPLVQVLGG